MSCPVNSSIEDEKRRVGILEVEVELAFVNRIVVCFRVVGCEGVDCCLVKWRRCVALTNEIIHNLEGI